MKDIYSIVIFLHSVYEVGLGATSLRVSRASPPRLDLRLPKLGEVLFGGIFRCLGERRAYFYDFFF